MAHRAPSSEIRLSRRRFGMLAAGSLASLALPRCTRAAASEARPVSSELGYAGGEAMAAGFERAGGLTAAEVAGLNAGRDPTLAQMGLARETILRCATARGETVWVQLAGETWK